MPQQSNGKKKIGKHSDVSITFLWKSNCFKPMKTHIFGKFVVLIFVNLSLSCVLVFGCLVYNLLLLYRFVLSCIVLPCSCLVLSYGCLVLSCGLGCVVVVLWLSCLVLWIPCLVLWLSCLVNALSCLVVVLSCGCLVCPLVVVLPCGCLVMSYLVMSCYVFSCLALPWRLSWPCLASLCPVLSCLCLFSRLPLYLVFVSV